MAFETFKQTLDIPSVTVRTMIDLLNGARCHTPFVANLAAVNIAGTGVICHQYVPVDSILEAVYVTNAIGEDINAATTSIIVGSNNSTDDYDDSTLTNTYLSITAFNAATAGITSKKTVELGTYSTAGTRVGGLPVPVAAGQVLVIKFTNQEGANADIGDIRVQYVLRPLTGEIDLLNPPPEAMNSPKQVSI